MEKFSKIYSLPILYFHPFQKSNGPQFTSTFHEVHNQLYLKYCLKIKI